MQLRQNAVKINSQSKKLAATPKEIHLSIAFTSKIWITIENTIRQYDAMSVEIPNLTAEVKWNILPKIMLYIQGRQTDIDTSWV